MQQTLPSVTSTLQSPLEDSFQQENDVNNNRISSREVFKWHTETLDEVTIFIFSCSDDLFHLNLIIQKNKTLKVISSLLSDFIIYKCSWNLLSALQTFYWILIK